MKRRFDKEEIRQFFQTCVAQFDEAGFALHAVRFVRDEDGNLADIHLNYSETDTTIQTDEKNSK